MTTVGPSTGPEPVASYPPEAYQASPATFAAPKNNWWTWLVLPTICGFVVGVVWWLSAPGGAFYGEGKDYNIWLLRDITLGGLGVAAGLISAIFFFLRGRQIGGGTKSALLALTVGSILASLLAWRTGVFMGSLFQTPAQPVLNPSVLFSLRSYSILLLWPMSVAAVAFVMTFLGQMRRGSERQNEA